MTSRLYDSFPKHLEEKILKILDSTFAYTPQYTHNDVMIIESMINAIYSSSRKLKKNSLFPFVYVLGETIVRNNPDAHWFVEVNDDGVLTNADIEIAGNQSIDIIYRMIQFFSDRDYKLTNFYNEVVGSPVVH